MPRAIIIGCFRRLSGQVVAGCGKKAHERRKPTIRTQQQPFGLIEDDKGMRPRNPVHIDDALPDRVPILANVVGKLQRRGAFIEESRIIVSLHAANSDDGPILGFLAPKRGGGRRGVTRPRTRGTKARPWSRRDRCPVRYLRLTQNCMNDS